MNGKSATAESFDPFELAYRLKRAGYSVTRLARELGMPRSTVAVSIYTGSSPRVRSRVAEILNCQEQVLWPFRATASEGIRCPIDKKPA
jgi:lambda repressor-like predicted transcriptional regulator